MPACTYGHVLRRKFVEEVMVDYRFLLNNFTKMAYINRSAPQTDNAINAYSRQGRKHYYEKNDITSGNNTSTLHAFLAAAGFGAACCRFARFAARHAQARF